MRFVLATILWIYDFLAEDVVLLVGMLIAVGLTVAAVHITTRGAGFVLWALVLLAIAVSLIRVAGKA